MIHTYILKSHEYSMFLDFICNKQNRRNWQKYFIDSAKENRAKEYSNFFECEEATHFYKIPSVFGARQGYIKIRKICKLLRKIYYIAVFERNENGVLQRLWLNERKPIMCDNHAILILSLTKLNDLEVRFLARAVGNRKFLKTHHLQRILMEFTHIFKKNML